MEEFLEYCHLVPWNDGTPNVSMFLEWAVPMCILVELEGLEMSLTHTPTHEVDLLPSSTLVCQPPSYTSGLQALDSISAL